jgi:hypothetical protein
VTKKIFNKIYDLDEIKYVDAKLYFQICLEYTEIFIWRTSSGHQDIRTKMGNGSCKSVNIFFYLYSQNNSSWLLLLLINICSSFLLTSHLFIVDFPSHIAPLPHTFIPTYCRWCIWSIDTVCKQNVKYFA